MSKITIGLLFIGNLCLTSNLLADNVAIREVQQGQSRQQQNMQMQQAAEKNRRAEFHVESGPKAKEMNRFSEKNFGNIYGGAKVDMMANPPKSNNFNDVNRAVTKVLAGKYHFDAKEMEMTTNKFYNGFHDAGLIDRKGALVFSQNRMNQAMMHLSEKGLMSKAFSEGVMDTFARRTQNPKVFMDAVAKLPAKNEFERQSVRVMTDMAKSAEAMKSKPNEPASTMRYHFAADSTGAMVGLSVGGYWGAAKGAMIASTATSFGRSE